MKTARTVARFLEQLETEVQSDEAKLARKRASLEALRQVYEGLVDAPSGQPGRHAITESGPASAVVPGSIPHRILEALAEAEAALTLKALTSKARAKTYHVSQAIKGLLKTRRIRKVGAGRKTAYALPEHASGGRR